MLTYGLTTTTGHNAGERTGRVDSLHSDLRLLATTRHREKDFIYVQGDPAGELYLVTYGCVRTSQVTPEGRRMVTGFHFPGDVFGFEPGKERLTSADALTGSGTRRIEPDARASQHLKVRDLLLCYLERLQRHLLILGTQNSIERVAAFLLVMAAAQGDSGKVRLPMSRCDIAEHLGLTLETVSRAMHRLELHGLIDLVSPRLILLLDRKGLAEMIA
jgi:CRP/FNR family nitrogen fixation transcriptional regulator